MQLEFVVCFLARALPPGFLEVVFPLRAPFPPKVFIRTLAGRPQARGVPGRTLVSDDGIRAACLSQGAPGGDQGVVLLTAPDGRNQQLKVSGTVFDIDKKFQFIRPIGTGAYGVVM
jgi:hypothetical protein